jgi:hypothetical protein
MLQSRRMNGRLVLLLLAASALACAQAPVQAPAPSRDPCRGTSFDADAPPVACMVKSEQAPRAPSPGALKLQVIEQATIRSGAQATFTLEMQNATAAPLTIDFLDGCENWDAQADDGKHRTFESECGGLCGTQPQMLRATVDPGGVVRKRVTLRATMRRVAGDDCKEKSLGPLPPGRYMMTVVLPWTDPKPIPEDDSARASRIFETPLVVTP